MAEKQNPSEGKENPFAQLKSLDGLDPDDGLDEVTRKFLAALSITYGGTDLFVGNEIATRFTIALDLADKINQELGGRRGAIDFMFQPFAVEEGRLRLDGEPFRVRMERVEGATVSPSEMDSASDPCCMWKWDPVQKKFICVSMC